MDGIGIWAGLMAAFFQALSYFASRWFVRLEKASPRLLLGISHLWMGVGALVLMAWLGWEGLHDMRMYGVSAAGATGFYLAGQMGLFMALRRAESSDIAPLLGLKVIFLATVSVFFSNQRFSIPQWGAIGLSVTAVFLLWERGGRIPPLAWAGVALAVVGYSLSDLSIKALVERLPGYGEKAPLAGVAVSYLLGAGVAPLWMYRTSWKRAALWGSAFPFSVVWFLGMIFLYLAFARVGVVFGNILQSTRGLMTVGMGLWLARTGWGAVESRQPRSVTVRRWAAAVAMMGAIGLYFF